MTAAVDRPPAIAVRDVRKTYRRYGRRRQFSTLKSALLSGGLLRDLRPDETFEALRGVSFDVAAGTTFGIIGRNGSGKSTMLKLIAGIGRPTAGTVHVRGRVSALIELGAGFHPEISGRENVYVNGMMLGLTKRDIAERFDEIVAFAELEEFIDAPVKTYSSGMYMRLGFAVAIHVDPDVLLVDEVLAVGDEAFTHRCLERFADLRRLGRTVLLVTHSLDLVTRFCDEALWLDAGLVRAQGDPRRIVDEYRLDVARAENEAMLAKSGIGDQGSGIGDRGDQESNTGKLEPPMEESPGSPIPDLRSPTSDVPPDMFRALEGRWGSREVEIVRVELLRETGDAAHVFGSGERVEIRLHVRAHSPVTDFAFGVGIFNAEGVCCFGTNTSIDGGAPGELQGDAEVRFVMDRLDLVDGAYKLDVAVHRENGAPYDYHRQMYALRITSPRRETGIFRPPHRWSFSGGIRMSGLDSPPHAGS